MHETTANAVRTLDRLELEAVERALAPAVERPEPVDFSKYTGPDGRIQTIGMPTPVFDAWCRAGKPDLEPRRAPVERPGRPHVPPAPAKLTSAVPRGVSWRELNEVIGIIGGEVGRTEGELLKEITELRKTVGALQQDGQYARDTNAAMGREMDAMKAAVAQIKRDHELAAKLETQRNIRRIESLEVALIAKGRSPYEGEDELPGSLGEWGRAQ